MRPNADDCAVVVLAGGDAQRLPGKLELDAGGLPLLARVVRNASAIGATYVSAREALPETLAKHVAAAVIFDRRPGSGPLGGLLSALERVCEPWFFALAGDLPFFDEACARRLLEAYEPHFEAIVPIDAAGRLQPLCALYDRAAFLRAGSDLMRESPAAVRAVVQRLRTKRVWMADARSLFNVNTPADREVLLQCTAATTR